MTENPCVPGSIPGPAPTIQGLSAIFVERPFLFYSPNTSIPLSFLVCSCPLFPVFFIVLKPSFPILSNFRAAIGLTPITIYSTSNLRKRLKGAKFTGSNDRISPLCDIMPPLTHNQVTQQQEQELQNAVQKSVPFLALPPPPLETLSNKVPSLFFYILSS